MDSEHNAPYQSLDSSFLLLDNIYNPKHSEHSALLPPHSPSMLIFPHPKESLKIPQITGPKSVSDRAISLRDYKVRAWIRSAGECRCGVLGMMDEWKDGWGLL